MLLFDLWCSVGSNQVKSTQRRLCEVWRFAFDHLYGHDPQTPYVNLTAIFFSRHNFRRHPIGRPDHCSTLVLRFIDLSAETKIG